MRWKPSLLAASVLVLHLPVQAAETKYYRFPDLLWRHPEPDSLLRARDATVRIQITGIGGSRVSGTGFFVSSEGHLLTALHVLRGDPVFSRNSEVEPIGSESDFSRERRELLAVLRNPVGIEIPALGFQVPVSVVQTGAGLIMMAGSGGPIGAGSRLDIVEAEYAVSNGDYALLKVDLPQGISPPCLEIAGSQPAAGDSVWALGFPGAHSETPGSDPDLSDASLGLGQYATVGEILPSAAIAASATPQILKSNMPIWHGMSGGPWVDAKGRATAISVVRVGNEKLSYGQNIQAVIADLRAEFAQSEVDRFFKCETAPKPSSAELLERSNAMAALYADVDLLPVDKRPYGIQLVNLVNSVFGAIGKHPGLAKRLFGDIPAKVFDGLEKDRILGTAATAPSPLNLLARPGVRDRNILEFSQKLLLKELAGERTSIADLAPAFVPLYLRELVVRSFQAAMIRWLVVQYTGMHPEYLKALPAEKRDRIDEDIERSGRTFGDLLTDDVLAEAMAEFYRKAKI